MTEPLPDTWHSRDLPVLREVVRRLDETREIWPDDQDIAHAIGVPIEDVRRAAHNLEQGGVVRLQKVMGPDITFVDFSARALELTGAWPTPATALERMLAALEAVAEHTDDDDTRTRARKLLDAMTSAGRTITLGVATAAITGQLPGQ